MYWEKYHFSGVENSKKEEKGKGKIFQYLVQSNPDLREIFNLIKRNGGDQKDTAEHKTQHKVLRKVPYHFFGKKVQIAKKRNTR